MVKGSSSHCFCWQIATPRKKSPAQFTFALGCVRILPSHKKRGINERLPLRFDYKDSATKACPKRRRCQVQSALRHVKRQRFLRSCAATQQYWLSLRFLGEAEKRCFRQSPARREKLSLNNLWGEDDAKEFAYTHIVAVARNQRSLRPVGARLGSGSEWQRLDRG